MLPFKRTPLQQKNKKRKSWDEAVQAYNLPNNGIEVILPGTCQPVFPKAEKAKPTKRKTRALQSTPSIKKPLGYIASRTLLLASGLAALGNIPVHSMIDTSRQTDLLRLTNQEDDASTPAQVLKELNIPAVAVESFSGFAVDALPAASEGDWQMYSIENGDDLNSALEALKLGKTAKGILENKGIVAELKKLKTGGHLLAQVEKGSLLQMIYAKDKHEAFIVSSTDNGYSGRWEKDVFELRTAPIAFKITHSILRDGRKVGLSSKVIHQISQIFRQDVDLKRGVRVGDEIGVIFEDFRYQGESIYSGQVLAAEFKNRGNIYQRIRFTLSDGKTNYFRPDGDTELKRTAFERKPIAGGRISSGFGFRRHPIFGFRKAHTGVDFAAPRGTPIHATADGSIKFMGRQRGYGNVVELRHSGGVSTLYGHMSAFKDGLASGSSVKRGDVIGYVGSTGTSTGNHVHYEYRINGTPQNPLSIELPKVGIMTASELRSFKTYAATMTRQLVEIRKLAKLDKPLPEQTGG